MLKLLHYDLFKLKTDNIYTVEYESLHNVIKLKYNYNYLTTLIFHIRNYY